MSRDARTNRRIRARELRVIGPEGEQLGIISLEDALRRAQEAGMDLVEVSPMAKPPVCKIMDYGRFKYDAKKKANEAKKKQFVVKLKEIKLRPRTDEHDYAVKVRQAKDFLEEGHKVKVTIIFRGREIAHRDIGQKQLQEMIGDLKDIAVVEQAPRSEGRTIFMLLSANPKVRAAGGGGGGGARPPAASAPPAPRPPSAPRPPAAPPPARPTFQAPPPGTDGGPKS